jgi:hypothetical protein
MTSTEIRCRTADWRGSIEIRARIRLGQGWAYMKPAEFDVIVSDGGYIDPSLVLPIDDAQRLMDELWNCGLRPTEGSGSAGALAATQRHLEDMRALVFQKSEA